MTRAGKKKDRAAQKVTRARKNWAVPAKKCTAPIKNSRANKKMTRADKKADRAGKKVERAGKNWAVPVKSDPCR